MQKFQKTEAKKGGETYNYFAWSPSDHKIDCVKRKLMLKESKEEDEEPNIFKDCIELYEETKNVQTFLKPEKKSEL